MTKKKENPNCPACKEEMGTNDLGTFYACINKKCHFAGLERVYWVWDK